MVAPQVALAVMVDHQEAEEEVTEALPAAT